MIDVKVRKLEFDARKVLREEKRSRRSALQESANAIRLHAKRAMEQSARRGRLKESELPPKLRFARKAENRRRREAGERRLRPLNKPSRPGQAPAASRSSPLNRLFRYAHDQSTGTVVVGPIGFPKSDAPIKLEVGGRSVIRSKSGKSRTIRIKARPAVQPAFAAERSRMPERWRDSISRG